jgi:transposase
MDTVVLESTGVSWMALFEVLDERGCDVKLVDAHQARQVPGRKTDVRDCQWLQELHTSGFLRGALRPEDEGGVLRSSLRHRSMLVAMASRGATQAESPGADAPQADRGGQCSHGQDGVPGALAGKYTGRLLDSFSWSLEV